jgi:CheY-like chemotaxis protein
VIENSAKTLALLCRIHECSGHAVTAAKEGQEGLRALERGRFDLVVTEIVMPRGATGSR